VTQRDMTALAYAREKGLADIAEMLSDTLYVADTNIYHSACRPL
jgi:hypothetical protein